VILLALSALSACVAAPPPPVTPPPAAAPATTLRVLTDSVDGQRWLAQGAARAIAAGAGALRVVGADVVAEGDKVGAFVDIPADECVVAFSRASPTIVDVDLFAFDDDGSAFAADESPEQEAAILVCPPHPRRLYVVGRVMAGSGVLGVGVQSVPRAAADAVARAVGARGRQGEDSGRLDAWPGLEAKIRAHREALGGRWEDVRRLAMPVSPRAASRLSASLEPGRCLAALVSPSEEVASLEVVVEDADARVIARARDQGRDRSLVLCASRAAVVTLAVRPRATPGMVAVTLSRGAPGAEPEIDARARVVHVSSSLELDAARAAAAALTAGLGYAAPTTVATGGARVGSRAAVSVDLPAGCARFDVLAGKPLVGLAAALWSDKGTLLADARAGASAALFTCGPGGHVRLDLEALESPGPFAVELRRDQAAPPALVAHPLAAARLLGRMSAGGAAADASAAASASVVALDETTRRALPITVPPGHCVEVLAALDAGGSGLDLRLVDGAGESTLARARYVTSDRVCATPGGKPASVELRVLSGKAEALVVTRDVGP
jgi:hypothetical protein